MSETMISPKEAISAPSIEKPRSTSGLPTIRGVLLYGARQRGPKAEVPGGLSEMMRTRATRIWGEKMRTLSLSPYSDQMRYDLLEMLNTFTPGQAGEQEINQVIAEYIEVRERIIQEHPNADETLRVRLALYTYKTEFVWGEAFDNLNTGHIFERDLVDVMQMLASFDPRSIPGLDINRVVDRYEAIREQAGERLPDASRYEIAETARNTFLNEVSIAIVISLQGVSTPALETLIQDEETTNATIVAAIHGRNTAMQKVGTVLTRAGHIDDFQTMIATSRNFHVEQGLDYSRIDTVDVAQFISDKRLDALAARLEADLKAFTQAEQTIKIKAFIEFLEQLRERILQLIEEIQRELALSNKNRKPGLIQRFEFQIAALYAMLTQRTYASTTISARS